MIPSFQSFQYFTLKYLHFCYIHLLNIFYFQRNLNSSTNVVHFLKVRCKLSNPQKVKFLFLKNPRPLAHYCLVTLGFFFLKLQSPCLMGLCICSSPGLQHSSARLLINIVLSYGKMLNSWEREALVCFISYSHPLAQDCCNNLPNE